MKKEPYARDYRESIKSNEDDLMHENDIEKKPQNQYPSSLYNDNFLDDTEIE